MFVNGVMKSAADSATIKSKRWSDTRGIQASNAIYMSPASVSINDPNQVLDEWGDFVSKDEKDFRGTAEKEKPRVMWGCERRCFLSNTSNNA